MDTVIHIKAGYTPIAAIHSSQVGTADVMASRERRTSIILESWGNYGIESGLVRRIL